MSPGTTHLRETTGGATGNAEIIDAKFEIVGRKRGGWMRRVLVFVFAVALAAFLGFMAPWVWIGVEELFATFR